MKACPECHSNKVYRYKEEVASAGGYGPVLLPALNTNWYSAAEFLPVVCGDCGLVRFYASAKAREKLKSSNKWHLMD